MLYFGKLRKQLGKNQPEMAEACGISRSAWQMIEYGSQLPSRKVADLIRNLSGVVVPCEDQCLTVAERRKWRRPRPFELYAADADLWTRVHHHCANMKGLYQAIEPSLLAWMEQMLALESVTEGFDLLQLAFHGATAFLDSPYELGFRRQPLVDSQGLVLGERKLAGLRGKWGEVSYLLWPQVSIRPWMATFRVDGLLLLSRKGKTRWCIREVDGPLHDLEHDRKRREILKLLEIRVTAGEVHAFQSVERTTEQVSRLFAA